jgi:hypothetical protein
MASPLCALHHLPPSDGWGRLPDLSGAPSSDTGPSGEGRWRTPDFVLARAVSGDPVSRDRERARMPQPGFAQFPRSQIHPIFAHAEDSFGAAPHRMTTRFCVCVMAYHRPALISSPNSGVFDVANEALGFRPGRVISSLVTDVIHADLLLLCGLFAARLTLASSTTTCRRHRRAAQAPCSPPHSR